jgi:hypothetical protein
MWEKPKIPTNEMETQLNEKEMMDIIIRISSP